MRGTIASILLFAASACGTDQKSRAVTQIKLTSEAFSQGQPIPTRFSCDGGHHFPPLKWSGAPTGTKSFVLTIDDPDAPAGTFHHLGLYDLPATLQSFALEPRTGYSVLNDAGTPGFTGPCPPKGDKPHHYHFVLLALNTAHLDLGKDPASAKVRDLERYAAQHVIGRGELIATYERR